MKMLFLFLTLLAFPRRQGTADVQVDQKVLVQMVNEIRKKGCNCGDEYFAPAAPLVWSTTLQKAAQVHSTDMFDHKYFSHTGQDGSSPSERIEKTGYEWKFYGENIADGYLTEKQVIEGWLASPGHCRNMMNKNFKEMGVARSGNLWTQVFGSR